MNDLSYAGALQAIAERGRFGIRLGLGRTRALLAGLGDPQLTLRGALVAGTNGKGSVLALAGSALRVAGYRVGLTPKPHLITYRERLEIDGRPIAPEAFAALVAEILPIADRVGRRLGPPTEFELLTAALFLWFRREHVDLALVEVGLGGRLDATHAWDGGVAVITNVDLDHMAELGPTVAAIAREKAAIIGRGDVAVTGATGETRAIIARRARRLGVSAGLGPRRHHRGPAPTGGDAGWASRPAPGGQRRGGGRPPRRAGGRGDRPRARRRSATRVRRGALGGAAGAHRDGTARRPTTGPGGGAAGRGA